MQFYCADLINECGLRGRVCGGHGVVLRPRHLARVGGHPVVPRQHPRQEVLPDHEPATKRIIILARLKVKLAKIGDAKTYEGVHELDSYSMKRNFSFTVCSLSKVYCIIGKLDCN